MSAKLENYDLSTECYTPKCAPGALGIWSEVICRGGAGYRTDILQPALRPPSNIGTVWKRRSEVIWPPKIPRYRNRPRAHLSV